jgi:pimeloyl-ACP methyl ester carboxylesterase
MDTVGYGLSPPFVDGEPSIERWADAALALMDTLGIAQVSVVGHHTGAVIGMEIAARAPQRVKALVLSSCPMVDAHRRAHHGDRPVVDGAERRSDGGHLLDLWRMRAPFYPPADVSLLERFLIDALRAGERAAGGHRVVNRYCMETRVGLVRCPTLVIGASEDPHAFPAAASVAGAITGARRLTIAGGMVPLPDQMPETFARAVINFLRTGASEIS